MNGKKVNIQRNVPAYFAWIKRQVANFRVCIFTTLWVSQFSNCPVSKPQKPAAASLSLSLSSKQTSSRNHKGEGLSLSLPLQRSAVVRENRREEEDLVNFRENCLANPVVAFLLLSSCPFTLCAAHSLSHVRKKDEFHLSYSTERLNLFLFLILMTSLNVFLLSSSVVL